jgi:hypothetical protein
MRKPEPGLSITACDQYVAPKSPFRRTRALGFTILILASELTFAVHYWPRQMPAFVPEFSQTIAQTQGGVRVYIPDRELIGELSHFGDSLFGYLMFDYYRSHSALRDSPVLLVSGGESNDRTFHVLVHLPSDLIAGVNKLAELKTFGLTAELQFQWITHSEFQRCERETEFFRETYQEPAVHHLEYLPESELAAYLRRFIRFKSLIDPRVRTQNKTVASPLSMTDSTQLAADVVAVSRFYEVPTELMLGIGAMENNYLNIPGDLENTAWKRRAQPGDIVIRRARGRVLVRNDSAGIWQITRESLRYAHGIYLKDKRDYSKLPERLRPGRKLDVNNVNSVVLTTYAGLLLRDLLDHFEGDVVQAAGAYNGTVTHPNLQYAAGVQMIANYARNFIGRAADLDRSAFQSRFLEQRDGILASQFRRPVSNTVYSLHDSRSAELH